MDILYDAKHIMYKLYLLSTVDRSHALHLDVQSILISLRVVLKAQAEIRRNNIIQAKNHFKRLSTLEINFASLRILFL